ncbi:hypothetical protein RIF29_23771 [Crotalaria pallida]|uniref:Hydroxyproline-rich glycoprotein family protein n=1 Tax=Crotalaria pallida TaxID=3830 RepID=A0AAN9IA51_CROPI
MDEIAKKKHIREPPSVPFLWEVKPGIPKKDWKPEPEVEVVSSVSHFPKTPLKLIASVPFVWEEKPGTPLPNYSSIPRKPHAMLIHVASSSGNSLAFNYSSSDESESIDSSSIGLEAFSFDTDESFSSVPSLLANCLVPSPKVSNVIPLNENSLCKYNCDQLQTPLSPTYSDTDSSTCSYATGVSSPVGASFLESLFPLYPPKRDVHSEKVISSTPQELPSHEDNKNCDILRKPPTLGELIMMSRRRSCRRKALQMRKWDPPKRITRNQASGCFNFVTSSNMLEVLLNKKYLPRLKLA